MLYFIAAFSSLHINIMIVTDNVRETQFTAGEALQFCHECKPSKVTATQK
jgi:hypothetical protein